MRPLDPDNAAAILEAVTAPRMLVRMGFDTDVFLTSGPAVIWPGVGSFGDANLDVGLGGEPTVTVFNEAISLGALVLAQGTAGRAISIWKCYVDAGATSSLPGHTEPVLLFQGQMGDATIGVQVQIQCRLNPPLFTPRDYVRAPVFNHLPKPGTIIAMPKQNITLE